MREFPFHVYSYCHPQRTIGAEGFDDIDAAQRFVDRLLANPAVTDLVIVDVHQRVQQTLRGVLWPFEDMLRPKYNGTLKSGCLLADATDTESPADVPPQPVSAAMPQ